jgi:hypothetical protein
MGPYMALIVPSSFYGIDAGLHALSFSLGEIKHQSCTRKIFYQIIKINKTQILLKYFFLVSRGVKFLEKRRENVQIFQALRWRFDIWEAIFDPGRKYIINHWGLMKKNYFGWSGVYFIFILHLYMTVTCRHKIWAQSNR